MKKSDEALTSFKNGITCSSAVFSAFSHELGLDEKMAKKIGCGFGAGVSRTGNICGTVSGAIMVIGLKCGKAEQGDNAATEKTRALPGSSSRNLPEKTGRSTARNCSDIT